MLKNHKVKSFKLCLHMLIYSSIDSFVLIFIKVLLTDIIRNKEHGTF